MRLTREETELLKALYDECADGFAIAAPSVLIGNSARYEIRC
jgi:hypothetical protein